MNSQLVQWIKDIGARGLALDSRDVKPGDVFFACQGTKTDGNQFIDAAIKNGASGVVIENNHSTKQESILTLPVMHVPHLSQQLGFIASEFYNNPSKKMRVVGITGTNGKTSCSHFIAAALSELQLPCGIIGTLGNGLYGQVQLGQLTTPDAITLQKTLSEFVSKGAKYTAMEVSSHSIDQGRSNGIDFAVSVFTNLSRDHLDYHGSMENYGHAKQKLFESDATKQAVINADDEFGRKIISDLHDKKNVFAYGIDSFNTYSNVQKIRAENIRLDLKGISALIHSPWGSGEMRAGLIGKFNISNLLAVITSLCLLDIPFEKALALMSKLNPVAGRMQTLGGSKQPLVVVDYSHSPDSLEKALIALRQHCQGKLYCVFGCGGDRDPGKRPMMAKIAEYLSDEVIVTDDNPRTESPEQIFQDILTGFNAKKKMTLQHDRAAAIRDTILAAKQGDCILIAGKGAEPYQIIGTEKIPFSDAEQVSRTLATLG